MSGEIEKTIRQGFHASRWILAPMYLGLALSLIVLLVQFVRDFFRLLPETLQDNALQALPAVLSLGLVLLAANAILVILQTGFQLYAPGLNSDKEPDEGRGSVDFVLLGKRFLGMSIALSILLVFREMLTVTIQGDDETTGHVWQLASLLGIFVGAALILAVAEWFNRLARK